MAKKRRRRSAAYKFRIALEPLEGSKTIMLCPACVTPAKKRLMLYSEPTSSD